MNEKIAENLLPLCVDIAEINVDKKNARSHPPRNIKALMTSLQTYGQRKPLVVNINTKEIEAGNGLYLAAFKLGWEKIAVVWVKDDEETAKGFALMDNQSGMLSDWDRGNLAALIKDLQDSEYDLTLTGFNQKEIDRIIEEELNQSPEYEISPELLESQNYIVLYFDNEMDWEVAKTVFGVKTVLDPDSKGEYIRKGLGRVIRGDQVLRMVTKA